MNHELLDVQAGFRKGRGTRDHIANIHWIIKKARELQKVYFCFIDYAKAFDCVDHNQTVENSSEMGIPDHTTCLLRNLYAGQEEQLELSLKLNIQKTKIMASSPITLWQMDGETMETVTDFILGGSKIITDDFNFMQPWN